MTYIIKIILILSSEFEHKGIFTELDYYFLFSDCFLCVPFVFFFLPLIKHFISFYLHSKGMVEMLIYLMLTVQRSGRILELYSRKRIWGNINCPFLFIVDNLTLTWEFYARKQLAATLLMFVHLFSFSWRFQVVTIPRNFRNKVFFICEI